MCKKQGPYSGAVIVTLLLLIITSMLYHCQPKKAICLKDFKVSSFLYVKLFIRGTCRARCISSQSALILSLNILSNLCCGPDMVLETLSERGANEEDPGYKSNVSLSFFCSCLWSFFKVFILYWSRVDLQHCVSFRYTAE